MDPLSVLPISAYGGETIYAEITIDGYLPADYTLSYSFAADVPVTITAEADGDTGWTLTVPAATTLAWRSGFVGFSGLATAKVGGRVTAVDSGSIRITASPLYVSWAKTALAAVEAAIAGRASSDQVSFTIGDMSVGLMPMESLIKTRDWLYSEAQKDGGNRMRRVILSVFR